MGFPDMRRHPVPVIELGSYIAPAYAGMVLAEQGYRVEKWTRGQDPILKLHRGDQLWEWINEGKNVVNVDWRAITSIHDAVVIDNIRAETLAAAGIDPAAIAKENRLTWVSLRADVPGRSFDIVAQFRAWGDTAPWVPFYIGDTAAGLWIAFKALAMHAAGRTGHFAVGQATCLAKLVEGEGRVDPPHARGGSNVPWDPDTYGEYNGWATVDFKGEKIKEPPRDKTWRLANLPHDRGRFLV